jgi:hypothetical protein
MARLPRNGACGPPSTVGTRASGKSDVPSYCPPVEDIVPPIYVMPDRYRPVPALATKLFRHYKRRAGSRNIYILTDGTVTQSQPWDMTTVQTTCFGGHTNNVTAAELAALIAAGFPSSC